MSMIAQFARAAALRRQQIALITERSQMTYADLLGMVQILDLQLSARGVRPGQTVVLASNRAEFTLPFALLASLRALRVIYAPLSAAHQGGLAFDWAIAPEPMPTVPPERQIIMDGGWFAALGSLPPRDDAGQESPGHGALVTHTSGSTGVPKFVMSSLAQRLQHIQTRPFFRDTDMTGRRLAITLSPGNVSAIANALSQLFMGGSLLMLREEQDRLPGYIDLYGVDGLRTTPVVLVQLAQLPQARQFLGRLRDVRVSGALTARAAIEQFGRVCPARLHLTYGATEIGSIFGFTYDRDAPQPEGFLGQPVRADIDILFFDESRRPLPPEATEGVVGFRVRDPAKRLHYLLPAGELQDIGGQDAVFFPGDILRRDTDGYHFIGRTSNIVNFSGEKFSLDLIAAHLSATFGGRIVVPVVDPDPDGLERITVATQGETALDREAVAKALADRFPLVRLSRTVAVPDMPLTANGKVDTLRLKRMIG